MYFYLTIGIIWGFFCFLQGYWQFHHLHFRTFWVWMQYLIGFALNATVWPLSMLVGIYKYTRGDLDVTWRPKTAAEKAFDRWYAQRSTIL